MDSAVRISLVCCTQVILQDIGAKEARQKDIALTYAMAIRSEACGDDKPDWRTINDAIVARWKASGLRRVKNLAWKIYSGEVHP
jgi:hypothetical protein